MAAAVGYSRLAEKRPLKEDDKIRFTAMHVAAFILSNQAKLGDSLEKTFGKENVVNLAKYCASHKDVMETTFPEDHIDQEFQTLMKSWPTTAASCNALRYLIKKNTRIIRYRHDQALPTDLRRIKILYKNDNILFISQATYDLLDKQDCCVIL